MARLGATWTGKERQANMAQSQNIMVRVDDEMKDAIVNAAAARQCSVSEFIRRSCLFVTQTGIGKLRHGLWGTLDLKDYRYGKRS